MRLFHNSRISRYREPFGAVVVNSSISLGMEIFWENGDSADDVADVSLNLLFDNNETALNMNGSYDPVSNSTLYTTSINSPSEGCLMWYYFVVTKNDSSVIYYGNNHKKLGGEGKPGFTVPEPFQITVYEETPAPEWFKEGIIYQIFPDRFARDENWRERAEAVIDANKDKLGQKKILEEDWYKPAYYYKDDEGNVTHWPFYGGSFKGIIDKLDYIKSLGVSIIYLNPIFDAVSNHRYDTSDYMKIDPMLGTEEDFKLLCDKAESVGIKIMLDGVFSHTGSDSLYFDKYGNYRQFGAFRNMDSPYRDWYTFDDNEKCGYKSWWGIEDLPEVNEEHPDFKELITGENGVLSKWTRLGASAWRLDVADELPDSFIKSIRNRVKTEKPDCMLLGEVWEDASNKISYGERRTYFMGEELDGTMNYPLRDVLIGFAKGEMSSSEAGDRLMSLKENYPRENFYSAMNLIGSHDRERILTMLGADYNYDQAARRVKMLSTLEYAFPGVPSIYYGDEAAMTGLADPANRSGFIWNRENTEMQVHFRRLGVLYNNHPALRSGELEFCKSSESVLAFLRWDADETILILANRGDNEVKASIPQILEKSQRGREILPLKYGLDLMTGDELTEDVLIGLDDVILGAESVKVITILNDKPEAFKRDRAAGVICHISSIPGGKLGEPARKFVDYLASAGMKLWQILPLNPTGQGGSPYSSDGAFAGNVDFVDTTNLPGMEGYQDFCTENAYWLQDYAIYSVLKELSGGLCWTEWPEDYPKSPDEFLNSPMNSGYLQRKVASICEWQYYFAQQWEALRKYANEKGIEIIGDLPIFVSKDSADAWANPEIFRMQQDGVLSCHAGVPPDYFSPEGQNWGNPLYNWTNMQKDGYLWWRRRLDQCRHRYDYIRLDHFRSFSEYYAIPEGGEPLDGKWQNGPGLDFFKTIEKELNDGEVSHRLKILAEDLGQLDAGVTNLLKLTGYPGMNIWQFSKDEMQSMTPEETKSRTFYTGTHDNQTLMGWCEYNGLNREDAFNIITELYESSCPWVVFPLQDLFLLGDDNRMNVPGTVENNWSWKVPGADMQSAYPIADQLAKTYRKLAIQTNRLDSAGKFVKSCNMYIEDDDLQTLTSEFIDYYKSAISENRVKGIVLNRPDDDCDSTVIAIDMGGTNVRIARIIVPHDEENQLPAIEERVDMLMLGRESEVTCNELFDKIAEKVIEIDPENNCSEIGFAFSFPATHEGRDERILQWAKELKVVDGHGLLAGELLNQALVRAGSVKRSMTVINDTVATLFSGNTHVTVSDNNCVAGYILGTGSNICFRNINTGIVYNLESGNYPGLKQGTADSILDNASINPGSYITEKQISGAYRVNLMKHLIAEAQKESVIHSLSNEEDRISIMRMQSLIDERTAKISAIIIAGAIIMATDAEMKTALAKTDTYYAACDGSVFWKTEGLADSTRLYANRILKPYGLSVEFVRTDEATLFGAAYSTQE